MRTLSPALPMLVAASAWVAAEVTSSPNLGILAIGLTVWLGCGGIDAHRPALRRLATVLAAAIVLWLALLRVVPAGPHALAVQLGLPAALALITPLLWAVVSKPSDTGSLQ